MLGAQARNMASLALAGATVVAAVAVCLVAGYLVPPALAMLVVGVVLLVAGAWRLVGAAAEPGLQALAIPLATATALPYLVAAVQLPATNQAYGGDAIGDPTLPVGMLRVLLAAAFVAIALGYVLVADALLAIAVDRRQRSVGYGVVAVAAVVAALAGIGVGYAWWGGWDPPVDLFALRWWACAVMLVVPAFMAMWPRRAGAVDDTHGGVDPSSAWVIAAVCTPLLTLFWVNTTSEAWMTWLLPWPWLVLLGAWRAVSRRQGRSRRMRDLVVAATEAERARLAADLHDVALQELTLLVRHLDGRGDSSGADMARSVSDRLRDLCGDLHLPILDELGAGPALDWLVHRIADATNEDVRLERTDETRPPAPVELAMFRIAQEALSNAVKYGRPPVVVRYVASRSSATLTVDDAGEGITVSRNEMAMRPGHFGMATMQQRAEQIGALLSIRAWPGGGTRVAVEWRT